MENNYPTLTLTKQDQEMLESWTRSRAKSHSLVTRAKIVLLNAQGHSALQISHELQISRPTVYKWVERFRSGGLSALPDIQRPGQPKKLSLATVKEILRMTVEEIPHEATHWSVRLMARYAGVTNWQVLQIWKEAGLKPHRLKTFKISQDPHFADKVVDVVGLYLDPPSNAVVLSVDEKTQIQALDRTQPMLPMKPGQSERRTHDYKRNGTASLYAAFDIATGEVLGRVTKRHRAKEFLDFLKQIDRSVPKNLDLHVILDNSSTHRTKEVGEWLKKHRRFKLHFTPTSASWLNAVESWFSQLERRALYRGVFTSVEDLTQEILRYIKVHNKQAAKPFIWTKKPAEIIAKHRALKNRLM